jgi:hypothetical protein
MTDAQIANVFAAGNAKSYAAGLRAVFDAGAASTRVGHSKAVEPPVEAPKAVSAAPKKRASKAK